MDSRFWLIALLPPVLGFCLDAILGDPHWLYHPIRLVGNLIAGLEKTVRRLFPNHLRLGGCFLAIAVILITAAIPLGLVICSYWIHWILGIAVETVLCYFAIAPRCLQKESMKVYASLKEGNLPMARKNVSMIVGRDTAALDAAGVTKAAVETVAENTSDGVTSPILYLALGGPPLGWAYKAVNTMDSMIGYRNEKYGELGWFAAKLDDIVNYLPARLTALLMILSAYLLRLDGANGYRIWKRDRRCHASPNSAQTESVCAGALHIQLAEDAYYFGVLHKKETIGDNDRPVEPEDIRRTNRLMYVTSILTLILALGIRTVVLGGILW